MLPAEQNSGIPIFELPSDCKGDGYDIACARHTDDKPTQEAGVIREKLFINGCFAGYMKFAVGQQVGEREARNLPVGTLVCFNRWKGQCYYTTYYVVRTYQVTPRKRGGGNYLKLVNRGGYAGGKWSAKWQGRILS